MTLDILKKEVLKLRQEELFEFAQFLLHKIKENESSANFQLTGDQLLELIERLNDIQANPNEFEAGIKVEKELINKYALDL